MSMFMGEFNHTIDAKGRLIIPSRFREELGQEFGEEDMRRWWREKDFSSVFNEKIITSDIDADSIVEMIYIDSAIRTFL